MIINYLQNYKLTRLAILFLPIFLIILTSCKGEKEKWPAVIDWINPPKVLDTRELEGTWSPGDLLTVTFQARSGSDGVVQPFELGLGIFPEKFCCRVPDEIVVRERFEPTSAQQFYILEWELPDDLKPQGDGIFYRIFLAPEPDITPLEEGGSGHYIIINVE